MLNKLFYILIFLFSSLFLAVLFYYGLRLDSTLYTFIESARSEPVYFWLYVFFTVGAIVLFGLNISLLVYKFKTFGVFSFKKETGTAAGSVVGLFASACPVCGATLLSLIGIAGGLASLPFYGLELKAASFALMALPLVFLRKEIFSIFLKSDNEPSFTEVSDGEPSFVKTMNGEQNQKCENSICSAPKNNSFNEKNGVLLMSLVLGITLLSYFGWNMLKSDSVISIKGDFLGGRVFEKTKSQTKNPALLSNLAELASEREKEKMFAAATEKVLPENGFQSKIYLGDAVLKLAQAGAIDKEKFMSLYARREGLPKELENVFERESKDKIILTEQNANVYLNLLWPLGLANYMEENKKSPISGRDLFNFASTGGWTLGKAENGGEYFNKFKIVNLTKEQEELATSAAKNIYRPCCGNSAFFQDCNHGSAILGLLELGASQGLSEGELYSEALAFNSFWFPDTYIKLAAYFESQKNTPWEDISPKIILSREFSSAYGFGKISKELNKLNLLPAPQGGAACGV